MFYLFKYTYVVCLNMFTLKLHCAELELRWSWTRGSWTPGSWTRGQMQYFPSRLRQCRRWDHASWGEERELSESERRTKCTSATSAQCANERTGKKHLLIQSIGCEARHMSGWRREEMHGWTTPTRVYKVLALQWLYSDWLDSVLYYL